MRCGRRSPEPTGFNSLGVDVTRQQREIGRVREQIERFEGRKFDYRPRNEFEEKYAYYPAQTVERIRNEVVMSALRGAAERVEH